MTSNKVIIIGGGGHARVLVDAIECGRTYKIIGYTDARPMELMPVPYLGTDDVLKKYPCDKVFLVNGIGSVDVPVKRRNVYLRLYKAGHTFASVIHPRAIVSSRAQLSQGVQVMAGSVVHCDARVGENALINTSASIDHDCSIGPHTHIAPGAVLSGGVVVGESVHVGTGATIIQGIRIGKGALVAAGAVVVNDVKDTTCVCGVPARRKKR